MDIRVLKKGNFLCKILFFLLIVCSAITLIISYYSVEHSIPAEMLVTEFQGKYRIVDGEWKDFSSDTYIPANKGDVTVSGNIIAKTPEGEEIFYISKGMYLNVYLNHINMKVYVNEELSCELDCERFPKNKAMCSKLWHTFEYPANENDTIKFVFHNPHRYGNSNAVNECLQSMNFGEMSYIEEVLYNQGKQERLIGNVMIISTVFIFGISIFVFRFDPKKGYMLLLMGISIVSFGMYFILDSENICIVVKKAIICDYGAIVSMILAFTSMFCVIVYNLKLERTKTGVAILFLSIIISAVCVIIDLIGFAKLYDMLLPWVITQGITAVVLFVCAMRKFFGSGKKQRIIILLSQIFLLALIADTIGTTLGIWQGMYYSKIAFIIILACVIIYSAWGIPQGMMTAVKARELENKLVKQKMALMLSQIQPHFIYNVLNSIYHLCEIDSSLAQKTITDFSDYLRINFSFKDVPDLIAFEKELKHIRTYLSLELLRFDDITVNYNISETNFMVPPLSIQPLVENSIKHGFKNKWNGVIEISVHKINDIIEITITDNGEGFDMNSLTNNENIHVGLESSKQRFEKLCNAEFVIESTVGKGTKIIIKFPANYKKEV